MTARSNPKTCWWKSSPGEREPPTVDRVGEGGSGDEEHPSQYDESHHGSERYPGQSEDEAFGDNVHWADEYRHILAYEGEHGPLVSPRSSPIRASEPLQPEEEPLRAGCAWIAWRSACAIKMNAQLRRGLKLLCKLAWPLHVVRVTRTETTAYCRSPFGWKCALLYTLEMTRFATTYHDKPKINRNFAIHGWVWQKCENLVEKRPQRALFLFQIQIALRMTRREMPTIEVLNLSVLLSQNSNESSILISNQCGTFWYWTFHACHAKCTSSETTKLKKTQKTRTEKGVTGRFCVAWYTHFSAWFCFQILIFVFYSTTVYACTTNFTPKWIYCSLTVFCGDGQHHFEIKSCSVRHNKNVVPCAQGVVTWYVCFVVSFFLLLVAVIFTENSSVFLLANSGCILFPLHFVSKNIVFDIVVSSTKME